MHRVLARLAAGVVTALVVAGCSGGTDGAEGPDEPEGSSASPTGEASEETSPTAAPPPAPAVGSCHRLAYEDAVAPTSTDTAVRCGARHTSQTFSVGKLALGEGDEALSVDDPAVQDKPAQTCPDRLPRFLGLGARALRLTMARAVWFTPTLEEAEAGAAWFRCDAVVLATAEKLLPLPRDVQGKGGREEFAMCGSARPGTDAFARVACARRHTWRAVASVDLPGPDRRRPPERRLNARMTEPCRTAARAAADDPLDFTWSQEVPTRAQWKAGQRYGLCWVPS